MNAKFREQVTATHESCHAAMAFELGRPIKVVSIRHYTDSVFVAFLDDPNVTVDNALSLSASLITVGCLVVVSVALTTWRLRTMNLE